MGGADQLPFDVACAQTASSEPPDPTDLLDVAEHRFNPECPLGVERSSSFGRQLVLHDPAAGSPEHTSARDFATALVALVPHGDEELGVKGAFIPIGGLTSGFPSRLVTRHETRGRARKTSRPRVSGDCTPARQLLTMRIALRSPTMG